MTSRRSFALAALLAVLSGCGAPSSPAARVEPRPAPALVVAHPDPTLLVHVDVAALRRSPFGPAASGKLLAEVARLGGLPFAAFCGQTATIDAFDDLVVSWRGANVRVGATFAKGLSEATKDGCARELASSADRRGDLMVGPPGLTLDPSDRGHPEVRFVGGRVAIARGALDDLTIDATLDTEPSGTSAQVSFATKTPIRARELAERLDRLLASPVALAKKAGTVDEAHVVQGDGVVLAVRFVGDAKAQQTSAIAFAEGLAAASVNEKGREELPEVRARIVAIAEAVERSTKASGGTFPGAAPWVPGVTPRGARVPVVSESANDESWAKIGISWRNERTAFRYRFTTSRDGTSATIEAHGDLDGDERESTFRVVITKKSDGSLSRGPLEELDPNE